MLTASEKNVGAIRAYIKAGFIAEGIMRQAFYRDGKFHDKIVMGILREQWNLTTQLSLNSRNTEI